MQIEEISFLASISGSPSICSGASQQYTLSVNGSTYGGSVTWSSDNTSILTITSSGNPATATKVGDGMATVTATITNACSGQTTANKVVQAGNSNPGGYYNSYGSVNSLVDEISGSNTVVPDQWAVAYMTSAISATPTWTQLGGYNYSWQVANNQLYVNIQSGGYAAFQMDINGECSGITKVYIFEAGSYRLSSNPANSEVTVYANDKDPVRLKNGKSNIKIIRQVIIRDKFGNAVWQQNFPPLTRQATLHVGSLSTGFYIIQIFDGKKWSSLKLMKN